MFLFFGFVAENSILQETGAPGEAWRRRMYGMLKPSIGTRRVIKPVRPSVLTAGTECCADWSNPGREAYTGSL